MTETAAAAPAFTPQKVDKSKLSRKTIRAIRRNEQAQRIKTDSEFAKKYFEAKSKRSSEKKVAYRKRHQTKK